MDVAKATGIPLPKILRLLNLAGGRVRNDEINGFELVRLCAYVGLPISAVVRMEDSE